MDRFALLTVRRMFSLLYYPDILPRREQNVKYYFFLFLFPAKNILCRFRLQ